MEQLQQSFYNFLVIVCFTVSMACKIGQKFVFELLAGYCILMQINNLECLHK